MEPKVLATTYDEIFILPYTSHQWASRSGQSHWRELEGWQDGIAGPVWHIITDGNCEYVYSRDDQFFSGVTDPADLRIWLLKAFTGLTSGIDRFIPNSPEESTDLHFMKSLADRMLNLLETCCEIEFKRWTQERGEK